MFITLTKVNEFDGGTNPCAFNINQIQYFYPVDTDDPEEKPEWNTVIVIDYVLHFVMEDFGYVSGAINEITSTRT